MSTPQSIIYICSGVKLNSRYEHTIYWDSRSAQETYFAGKVVKTLTGYTFLRKSWSIKVEGTMASARSWDYLYFTNNDGRYWYYFINQVEYVNDSTVELFLELDVMQTYACDYELLPCFVERHHVLNDGIGQNCVDEGLDVGELTTQHAEDVELAELSILIMSTIDPTKSMAEDLEEPVKILGSYYDGVFNGVGIFGASATDWRAVANILAGVDKNGFSDGIISMWMYPTVLITYDENGTTPLLRPVAKIKPFYYEVSRPDKLAGGYVPRNNKLYTYPYNFLYVTNNSGNSATYRYERFGIPSDATFKITGALSPEGEVRMYPIQYDNMAHAYEHGISLTGFPTCAWNQDTYKLWIAQNQNQQNLSLAVASASVVAGVAGAIATGGAGAAIGIGTAIGGAQTIASILAQRKDQHIQPPQSKGGVSASVNTVAGFQTFTIKRQTVTYEMAQVIDGYFDLYGYKINYVQTPNPKTRENWTYIKTVGCHINGSFAVEDVDKIESIFDNGITFWRNGDNIGKYHLSNKPLS